MAKKKKKIRANVKESNNLYQLKCGFSLTISDLFGIGHSPNLQKTKTMTISTSTDRSLDFLQRHLLAITATLGEMDRGEVTMSEFFRNLEVSQ